MKFVEADEMESAALRELIAWYENRRRGDAWPPVSVFRVETMPPKVLPHMARVEVSKDPFRVYYRAVGSVISESLGTEVSGKYLDELGTPQAGEVAEWYRMALEAPDPLLVRGEQTVDGHAFTYEGCCLPLGDADDDPRAFIIGEDFLNIEAWFSALRERHYDKPT